MTRSRLIATPFLTSKISSQFLR